MNLDFKGLLARSRDAAPDARGASGLQARLLQMQFSLSPKQRAEVYEMLGALIADGKPLDASARALRDRFTAKKRPLAPLLRHWVGALDEGKSFADAIKGYAADTEVVIIAATEKSGDLATGFSQAAGVARASAAIRGTMFAELSVPTMQVVALLLMLVGFSLKMAPELVRTVPLSSMDESQRTLFALADVVAQTWHVGFVAMAAAAMATLWSMPRYSGSLRPYLDKIPPWSIYRIYSSATFAISLSSLIRAGVPIESALRFIRQQSSPWMREHMSVMVGRMRAGIEQGEALDTGLLSERMADMVAIYSKTASFDAAVSSVGRLAMEDGMASIKKQAGRAKLASLVLIGVFVGWMFVAVMGIGDAATRATKKAPDRVAKEARK